MIRPIVALLCLLAASPTEAAMLDHVRSQGVVRCGGVIRPGLAFPLADHGWSGLEVEMCRAIAVAVLNDPAAIEFRSYVTEQDFARAHDGRDDVAFLTGSELSANGLFGQVLAGPPLFYLTTRIMVQQGNAARHVDDLAGTMVCAEPGTGPERNLHDYMRRHAIGFRFSMWQETEEMMDAFNVGRCPAMAGEETALAALMLGAGQDGHPSRLLPEALAASPVLAVTGAGDAAWVRIVFWTVQTVLAADRKPGVQGPALPVPAPPLGLAAGWQGRVLEAAGTYAEMFDRSLGPGSLLQLPAGVNARWDAGGLFAPPTVE